MYMQVVAKRSAIRLGHHRRAGALSQQALLIAPHPGSLKRKQPACGATLARSAPAHVERERINQIDDRRRAPGDRRRGTGSVDVDQVKASAGL
jgi:hypothetical protein